MLLQGDCAASAGSSSCGGDEPDLEEETRTLAQRARRLVAAKARPHPYPQPYASAALSLTTWRRDCAGGPVAPGWEGGPGAWKCPKDLDLRFMWGWGTQEPTIIRLEELRGALPVLRLESARSRAYVKVKGG